MSRLATPAREDVAEASKPILDAVHKQLGVVPNTRAGRQFRPPARSHVREGA